MKFTAADRLRRLLADAAEGGMIDMSDRDENTMTERFVQLTGQEFLQRLASGEPTPGGGTASASAGAAGAALVVMVAGLTVGRKGYEDVSDEATDVSEEAGLLREELQDLMDEDSLAFEAVMEALRMPKGSDQDKKARRHALRAATRQATEVPLQVMRRSQRVVRLAARMAEIGNRNALSDALVAAELGRAAVRGAAYNVRINLSGLSDEDFSRRARQEMQDMLDDVDDAWERIESQRQQL